MDRTSARRGGALLLAGLAAGLVLGWLLGDRGRVESPAPSDSRPGRSASVAGSTREGAAARAERTANRPSRPAAPSAADERPSDRHEPVRPSTAATRQSDASTDEYADWSYERLIRTLSGIPAPGEWGRRGAEEGTWDFASLQAIEPLIRNLRTRFPDREIPPEVLEPLFGWRGSYNGGLRSGIDSWSPATLRSRIQAYVDEVPDDHVWSMVPSMAWRLRRAGRPLTPAEGALLLRHESGRARAAAVAAVPAMRPPPVELFLDVARRDTDPRVREAALWNIAELVVERNATDEEVASVVLAALEDTDPDVRESAISAMRHLCESVPASRCGRRADAARSLLRDGGMDGSTCECCVEIMLLAGRLTELLRDSPTDLVLATIAEKAASVEKMFPERFTRADPAYREALEELGRVRGAIRAVEEMPFDDARYRRIAADRTEPIALRVLAMERLASRVETGRLAHESALDIVRRHDEPADMRRSTLDLLIAWDGGEHRDEWRPVYAAVARDDPSFWIRVVAAEALRD